MFLNVMLYNVILCTVFPNVRNVMLYHVILYLLWYLSDVLLCCVMLFFAILFYVMS